MKEMVGGCCVCSDDRGWPENPLVYCDGQSCTVAVHQACYGIVTVPTGPWFCRKCESQDRNKKVKCELCPCKYGALKRTDNHQWAHVVCALYIPEVRFGNVTTMEPIQLQLIPAERFNKTCYICEERGKQNYSTVGACMQCNKAGCKQQFHVTCGQTLGLLCEEAGNYLDNVKYCGYCQYHFGRVRKGGHVKTIPPYKPLPGESETESDKETDAGVKSLQSAKRKAGSSSSKYNSSKTSSSSKSSSSSQKSVHSSKSGEKVKVSTKPSKTEDSSTVVNQDSSESKSEKVKEVKSETELDVKPEKDTSSKGSKKRKTSSRTPTPISIVPPENISVVINSSSLVPEDILALANEKKSVLENTEKPKKPKTEVVVTTSESASLPPIPPITVKLSSITPAASCVSSPTASITSAEILPTSTGLTSQPSQSMSHHSLVVSVPLHNTSLSPSTNIVSNPTHPVNSPPAYAHLPQDVETSASSQVDVTAEANTSSSTMITTSDGNSGGLKITYEKQPGSTSIHPDLENLSLSNEAPVKRSRSQSGDKPERQSRSKKRGSNGVSSQSVSSMPAVASSSKRSKAQETPPPQPPPPTTPFSTSSAPTIKDSPPSSPSDESVTSGSLSRKPKSRKSAPASVPGTSANKDVRESKDIKLFQNGIHAPHMLGNQLNPNSNMAAKMTDHLNSELEAHSIFNPNEASNNLVGPQMHHRIIQSARSSSAGGSSTASGGSGLSSMLGGNGGAIPQTLDQLLERQWEQGSQFLMEQAQHFDIASLLSCLHQLRAENLRLEEHVSSLLQRRDHLLAVNARLAIPLTGPPATPQSSHPHTVNNIHPAVAASHADVPRARLGGMYPSHGQNTPQLPPATMENGLPPESNQGYPHQHRSPATSQPQPSPNVRW